MLYYFLHRRKVEYKELNTPGTIRVYENEHSLLESAGL